jgi:hypothetical protein
MTHVTIEILSLAASLAAMLGTVIVVDWLLIREWYFHLWDGERYIAAKDQAEYMAEEMEMQETHEASHLNDSLQYDITKPMPLPEPWGVVPLELRSVCYRDDEIIND